MCFYFTLLEPFFLTSGIPVVADLMAIENVKVMLARLTWLSCILAIKSLVNLGWYWTAWTCSQNAKHANHLKDVTVIGEARSSLRYVGSNL